MAIEQGIWKLADSAGEPPRKLRRGTWWPKPSAASCQNTVCKPTTPKWSHTVSRLNQVWRINDER